ncbi:MAG: hypothetical protein M3Q63_04055 [bacterium]|nr:hypothetical protein [bacterium]
MSVEFDEKGIDSQPLPYTGNIGIDKSSPATRRIVTLGIVNNERNANILLLSIAIVLFVITIFIYTNYVFGFILADSNQSIQNPN